MIDLVSMSATLRAWFADAFALVLLGAVLAAAWCAGAFA
jgi:hypothetical protein